MAIKKAYLAIFLIGVIIAIAGISVYGIYQRDKSQTPNTIYKGLTEAEEEIVKENIRNNLQQQKRKQAEIVDNKQPSSVDNAPIQNNNEDYKPEHLNEAPIAKETRVDQPVIVTSDLPPQIDVNQADITDIENLHKQFAPKGVDWGNTETIKITSMDDLKKMISDLKDSGDPKYKVLTKFLKDADMNGAQEINVQIVK